MTQTVTEKLRHLPDKPGVYLMKDAKGEVIYVGKAVSLRSRVRSYFQKGQAHAAKTVIMVEKIADIDWMITDTELEALMLECNLIKKYRPHYNICLRDDKHYPYLCVTASEPFPRVLVVRRSRQDGNRYFGPYADTTAMRRSLRLIRKIFRIRSCNKKLTGTERDRPCLNHHLGQCDSPCSGAVCRDDYAALVQDTIMFLEGHEESLAASLTEKMNRAAESLEFERAARYRDSIQSIKAMVEKQKVISTDPADQDVIAIVEENASTCAHVMFIRNGKLMGQEYFFMDGALDELPETAVFEFIKQYYRDAVHIPKEILVSHEPSEKGILEDWLIKRCGFRVNITMPKRGFKRSLVAMARENAKETVARESLRRAENAQEAAADLEELKKVLGMPDLPMRIETYDISNTQGRESVGSMVVFQKGVPARGEYRRFKIKTVEGADDFASMKEVIKRRLAAAASGDKKFTRLPDLMVIDGGKGQLNAALLAISQSGMQVNVVSLAKKFEEIYTPGNSRPMLLPRDSRALRLLQRTRDEAHRFAVTYHRNLRDKSVRKSVLDGIAGVGDARRKALVRRFGSVAGVKTASLDELAAVPGMTKSVAQAVYYRFHAE